MIEYDAECLDCEDFAECFPEAVVAEAELCDECAAALEEELETEEYIEGLKNTIKFLIETNESLLRSKIEDLQMFQRILAAHKTDM